MSEAALHALLPGNTLYHVNAAKGIKVPLFYARDGKRDPRLRADVTESAWRINDDRVCEDSVVLNPDVCRRLYRFEGRGRYVTRGTRCATTLLTERQATPRA